MDKTALRKKFLERRRSVSIQEVPVWSAQLSERLWAIPEVADAEHIMTYLAMPREANIDAFITEALRRGQ